MHLFYIWEIETVGGVIRQNEASTNTRDYITGARKISEGGRGVREVIRSPEPKFVFQQHYPQENISWITRLLENLLDSLPYWI